MPQQVSSAPRPRRRRVGTWSLLAVAAALALSGCDYKLENGFLPSGASSDAGRVHTLWNGAWIALLVVGALVWGLMIWCIVAYRRKKGDNELPVQLRYNIPIEILYTVVPIMMIAVFFYFTARDETALTENSLNGGPKPDLTVNVVGKRWSWDFNYLKGGPITQDVHEAGTQAIMTGQAGAEETIPTLYLPVGKRVEFVLTTRDVIHSFWVPQFLKKQDMITGRVNRLQVVPTQVGTFQGKCAELCGAYHSQMLFNVKVVSEQDFATHMSALAADPRTQGLLPDSLNVEKLMKGQTVPDGQGK